MGAFFFCSQLEVAGEGHDGGAADADGDLTVPLTEDAAYLAGAIHVLPLQKDVLLPRLHVAAQVEVVGQRAVAGAGGALLGNVVQGRVVAAIGGDGTVAGAEHMDAGDIILFGQLRDGGGVLNGAEERVVIPDGQHDVGKAGGDDAGGIGRRNVRKGEAVGGVERLPLLRRNVGEQAGRRHVHPDGGTADGDVQVAGSRVGGVVAVGEPAQQAQQGEGRHRGVTAQLHLPRRGEVAEGDGAVRLRGDERRFGVLQLRGDTAHGIVGEGAIRQGDARLIAAEDAGGKGIHDVEFHRELHLQVFLIKMIIYCRSQNGNSI